MPLIRNSSTEAAAIHIMRFEQPLPPTPSPEPATPPSLTSSALSPSLVADSEGGLIPAPKCSPAEQSGSRWCTQLVADPAGPTSIDSIQARPRASSDSMPCTSTRIRRGDASFPPRIDIRLVENNSTTASGPAGRARTDSDGSLPVRSRTRSIAARPVPTEALQHAVSTGGGIADQRNAVLKFLRVLPTWLPGRSSTMPPSEMTSMVEPSRRMKGEVECIHYGTIDDAG